jgi:hypothetical protein
MSRLIGRLLIFAALLPATGAKAAQSPAMTQVQDTLYRADGSPAQGRVTVRWDGFTTAGGAAVAAGELTVFLDANGNLSLPLVPNAGATPAGGYYKATIKLSDGTTSEETWVVPATGTATLSAIRATIVPQNVAAQFVTQSSLAAEITSMMENPGPIGGKMPSSVNATVVWTEVVNGEYNAADFSSIQSAINAAVAAGVYKVKVPEGTYTGNVTIPSGVTLECVSRNAVLTIANGANTDVVTFPAGAANATIKNCSINGNGTNQTAQSRAVNAAGTTTNIVLDNVNITNAYSDCIDTVDSGTGTFSDGFVLTNSTINGCGGNAVELWSMNDVTIKGNTISNWGQTTAYSDAIEAAPLDSVLGIQPAKNYTITDNVFNNASATKFGIELYIAFPTDYFSNVHLDRNTLNGGSTGETGFSVGIYGGTISGNTFNNPTIVANPCAGLCEINGNNLAIVGNAINGGTIDIVGDQNGVGGYTVAGNVIVASLANARGIVLANESNTVNHATITGNTILMQSASGTCQGVILGPSVAAKTVSDIKINNNTLVGNSACVAFWAAAADGSSGVEFRANTVTGFGSFYNNQAEPTIGTADLTITDNKLVSVPNIAGSMNTGTGTVRLWNNIASATDTQQHLNGGAAVDTNGAVSAPGGLANGPISAPPSSGLVGWYQASANCTTNGATLTTWTDSSASAINLAGGTTPGTCETNVVNGQPTVRFSSTSTGYQATSTVLNSGLTLLVVYRKTIGVTNGVLTDGATYTAYPGLFYNGSATTLVLQESSQITGTVPDDGNFHIAAYSLSTAGAGAIDFDGTQIASGTPGAVGGGGLTIGAFANRTNGFTGDIAEVLAYSSPLTLAQVQNASTYLANKYGLAPVGSWYVNSTASKLPGEGTVTNVSVASNLLSPLFSCSVTNPSTAPAISCTALGSVVQNAVLAGPASGGAGAWSFRALASADIPNNAANTTGTAASFTGSLGGDVTGTQSATTVTKVNGTALSGLATGILKNTTSTGVPTIAVAGTDYVSPNGVNVTSAYSNATTSYTAVLAMASVPAGATVRGRCMFIWEDSGTSGTVTFAAGASATPTGLYVLNTASTGTSGATTTETYTAITSTTQTTISGALMPTAATTGYKNEIDFLLVNGSSANTVTFYAKSSSTSYTVYVQPGSYCTWLP